MDDHTFCLLRLLDEKIRRAALLIEQHQIHAAELDGSGGLRQATSRGRFDKTGSPAVLSHCPPHRAVSKVHQLRGYMSTYLDELVRSLEQEANETRVHLRTYPPPRLMARTIAEQNLKRIDQRLATLHDLQAAELNRKKRPGRRQLSPTRP